MGLEVVLNQILQSGQKEESDILEQAQYEREKILVDARGRADALRQKGRAQADAKIESLRREIISAAEFEARRRTLVARRELAEDFHRRVLAGLSALPAPRNQAIVSKLAERAKAEIPKGVSHARKADQAILAKAGFKAGTDVEGAGGFRVESADGSVVLDHRYETLLENAWKDILTENQSLFEA